MKKQDEISGLIVKYLQVNDIASSKEIYDYLKDHASYATIKRKLQTLVISGQVGIVGNGKSSKYRISDSIDLLSPIDVDSYFQKEIDEREIKNLFNHTLIRHTLKTAVLFQGDEKENLIQLKQEYTNNISTLSEHEYKKEMERLAIDLSWKSSQMEGNTYSLLETEHLLKEKQTAFGKTKDEAVMLLNHKSAIDYILENSECIHPLSISAIEDIYSMLIKDLNVSRNIRSRTVGITGTNYKPLDNEFQIREAVNDMCDVVNNHQDIFEKAFLVLLLISYIQPFADGTKRTARIVSNAILINNNMCPLSYRTVNPVDYKKAMLIFYEQNNINAFKKIFIEQCDFAVKSYF